MTGVDWAVAGVLLGMAPALKAAGWLMREWERAGRTVDEAERMIAARDDRPSLRFELGAGFEPRNPWEYERGALKVLGLPWVDGEIRARVRRELEMLPRRIDLGPEWRKDFPEG